MNLILAIFRHVDSAYIIGYLVLSYVKKLISNAVHFLSYFLLLNKLCGLMSLNYATYYRYVQKIKHYFCFGPFTVFIYGKFNSTITYIFSIFMVLKLCKDNLKIIHLISDRLIFLGSVDIRDYLVVASVER